MTPRMHRRNERLLDWVRLSGVTLATWAGLMGLHFAPAWGALPLAILVAGACLVSIDLGVIVAVIVLALPLLAVNPIVGGLFAVIGVVFVRYLGVDGARVFLLMALAIFGAFHGPVWAAVAVAGFLMGAGEGAIAAVAACLAVEAVAIGFGIGATSGAVAGGSMVPMVGLSAMPASLFSAGWIPAAFSGIDAAAVDHLGDALTSVRFPLALALQPLVWGLGAALTASFVKRVGGRSGNDLAVTAAVATGALIPAAGTFVIAKMLGAPVDGGVFAWATLSSALVAGVFTFGYRKAFPLEPVSASSSLAADDAEVDDLLRLIATAEERLATRHTTTKVVLITDVKSFSQLTEEVGSITTAKAIQRHRDLLLPIIEAYHGRGKSTGGDGLVAAFDRPFEALEAAAAMQRALAEYNAQLLEERPLSVRIGVARGEVVLDKSGRPFIGAGLNLAARVMNLADGGRIFATADLLSIETSALRTHPLGTFELKNIAQPVEIAEVLWDAGQSPTDLRDHPERSSE